VEPNDLALQQIAAHFLYIPFVYENLDHPVLARLKKFQVETHFRASDFMDQGMRLLTNYQKNLQSPCFLARECFGKFAGVSAVLCGAGASLKEAVPILKGNRDRFLILGCGAGVEALLAAGIKPDLAVHVDPDPAHQFSKTDVPLFFQLRTSYEVVSQMKGPRFLMAGAGSFPLESWIEKQLGLEPPSDGGWTATTRGASLAKALGCSAIYFAGVDFKGPYAKGIKIKDAGQRDDWAMAAEWLEEWRKGHPTGPLLPGAIVPPFSIFPLQEGKKVWHPVAASFGACRELISQFLDRLSQLFPNLPGEDEQCQTILQSLEHQIVVEKILNPIWDYWESVYERQSENHPDALTLHRLLLLKSLADQFYAT